MNLALNDRSEMSRDLARCAAAMCMRRGGGGHMLSQMQETLYFKPLLLRELKSVLDQFALPLASVLHRTISLGGNRRMVGRDTGQLLQSCRRLASVSTSKCRAKMLRAALLPNCRAAQHAMRRNGSGDHRFTVVAIWRAWKENIFSSGTIPCCIETNHRCAGCICSARCAHLQAH